jgi:ABC-type transporter Mla subunit MlaD
MRYPDAVRFPGMILWAGQTNGPRVVPGTYQVKLTVDGQTMTESFEVKPDPRLPTTAADYAKQLDLSLRIRDKLSETHNAILQIRDVKKQIDDLVKRVGPQSRPIADAGNALTRKLTDVEEALYQTKNQSSQDPLNFPIRLNNKLAALMGVVARSETPPNDQSLEVYNELSGQIDAQLQKLSQIMKTDVPAFNQLVKEQNIPAIVAKPVANP